MTLYCKLKMWLKFVEPRALNTDQPAIRVNNTHYSPMVAERSNKFYFFFLCQAKIPS